MTPKAVLLDCDGVLVDSEPPTFEMLAEDFTRFGLTVTAVAVAERFTGGTIHDVAARARGMGAELPAGWAADFYERLFARLAKGVPVIPGVEDVLDRLDAAGIPYAVGSNGIGRKMAITLGPHPRLWGRLRDRLFSGQELGMPKPQPGLWLHCAAFLGVDPADCVVVDDSPVGCRAARAAGIRAMGFAAHGDGAGLAAEGAEVFGQMADLPGMLGV
jgi:beta-phosphoglucomutase-like phosphatase (HAD superfamily)